MTSAATILGVGIATLDIINEVASYPAEDAEVRALAQRQVRGGNVSNSLTLLSQFGHRCRWLGTLAADAGAEVIRADLQRCGIAFADAVVVPGAATPTSYIALSRANGSRTIVHHRDLRELTFADFARVPLGGLDWVHFEGRNPTETARMMARVRATSPGAVISVELEKPRPEMALLEQGPAVILAGRLYAEAAGYQRPESFLEALLERSTARLVVVGWGSQGACCAERGGRCLSIPAWHPPSVVDTLGAGDSLNAGVIQGLLGGLDVAAAVSLAVRLAGYKCGHLGFDGLIAAARRDRVL